VPPPVTARPEFLPLNAPEFHWDQFEGFARSYFESLPGVVDSKNYGKQGSKQRGIDLWCDFSDGTRWLVQCKQQVHFSLADTKAAIRKFSFKGEKPVTNRIIFVSSEVGSTVRDYVRKKKGFELWDGRDISHKVRNRAAADARKLVGFFGQQWVKLFLGMGPLSPFQSPDEYFAPFRLQKRLFNHLWKFTGRTAVLLEAETFLKSSAKAGILTGRGGIGKSRLLAEVAIKALQIDRQLWVLFLRDGITLTNESLGELPTWPTLIVVDDAHRRDDLKLLLDFAGRAQHQVRLLLSIRPQAIDSIRGVFSRANYDPREIFSFAELKELARTEVYQLAEQALGPEFSYLADQLVKTTWDCPLITVVGGQLLATKAIEPALLANDADFYFVVLERFQEEMIGNIGPGNYTLRRDVLKLTSACAPIYPEEETFLATAGAFIGCKREELVQTIGELEMAGILLRRGRSLRITPDVLSDHILGKACIAANRISTGYGDKVFFAFAQCGPERVLRNLAELDWRLRRGANVDEALLAGIWVEIGRQYAKGPSTHKISILEMVKAAAYFQPAQALKLIKTALRRPTPNNKGSKKPLHTAALASKERALIAAILRDIAYNSSNLVECCEVLWDLGKDDPRPTSPFPDHPIRRLQEIAAYEQSKPVAYNAIFVNLACEWLDAGDAASHKNTPLLLFETILEKHGETTRYFGDRISVSPFLVSYENTKQIRIRAFESLRGIVHVDDPKLVGPALVLFRKLLADDFGIVGKGVSTEYISSWRPEKEAALRLITEVARNSKHIFIQWRAMQALDWAAQDHRDEAIRLSAQAAINSLPSASVALRLYRAFLHEPLFPSPKRNWALASQNAEKAEQLSQAERNVFRATVVRDLIKRNKNGQKLFAAIENHLKLAKANNDSVDAAYLWPALVKESPCIAIELAEEIIRKGESLTADSFYKLLYTIGEAKPNAILNLLDRAFRANIGVLNDSLALYFRFTAPPQTATLPIFRSLLKLQKGRPEFVMDAVRAVYRADKKLGLQLFTFLLPKIGSLTVTACCKILEPRYGIAPTNLAVRQVRTILRSLTDVPDLEDSSIQDFLSFVSGRYPETLVRFFLKRLKHPARRKTPHFTPVPFRVHFNFEKFKAHPKYPVLLKEICSLVQQPRFEYDYYLPKIFWLIVSDETGLKILMAALRSGKRNSVLAAGRILSDTHENFAFERPEVIDLALTNAHRLGDKCYRRMLGMLTGLVVSGTKTGVPGQPMPRDVEVRDRAQELMERYSTKPHVASFFRDLKEHAVRDIKRTVDEFAEQMAEH